MKKYITLFLILFMYSCFLLNAHTDPSGSGSSSGPYDIAGLNNLCGLSQNKSKSDPDEMAKIMSTEIPFVQNEGQHPDEVKYYARTFYGAAYITSTDLVHSIAVTKDTGTHGVALREQFVGIDGSAVAFSPRGMDPAEARVSYFIGNDPDKWQIGLATCNSVLLGELYPGIAVSAKAHGNNVEKLFTVVPGADPADIRVRVGGADSLLVAIDGSLTMTAGDGDVSMAAPKAFQEGREISVGYRILPDNSYGFTLGRYDQDKPLLIDPSLKYSSYLGGSDHDYGNGISVDGAGNVYVTGYTSSTDFPIVNAFQPIYGKGNSDVFVTKIDATPSIVYSSYLGGSGEDQGRGISVDSAGNVYVTGYTSSTDFPIVNAFQGSLAGGNDAFVAKIDATPSIVYSSYLGGSGEDQGHGISADSAGNVYVTGYTSSTGFLTLNAFQGSLAGGNDAFVAKINGVPSIVYSSYLGGSGYDYGYGISADSEGNVCVTGTTSSDDFLTLNAFQGSLAGGNDVFVTKIDAMLDIVFSSYLGGSDHDYGYGISVDSAGNVFVTGYTSSDDFPIVDASQSSLAGGNDAFVAKINGVPSIVYSSYLGGSGEDQGRGISVDSAGNVYVTGYTSSTDFSTLNAFQGSLAGGNDAFVSSFTPYIPGLWTGATSTDWHTGSNWDDGNVPTTTINVQIPDTANDPVISANTVCQNLTLEDGALLTVGSSYILNVSGDMVLDDGSSFTNNGTLQFSGADCHLSDNRTARSSLGNISVQD